MSGGGRFLLEAQQGPGLRCARACAIFHSIPRFAVPPAAAERRTTAEPSTADRLDRFLSSVGQNSFLTLRAQRLTAESIDTAAVSLFIVSLFMRSRRDLVAAGGVC